QSKAVAIVTDDLNKYDVVKLAFDDIVEEKSQFDFVPTWDNEVIFCSSGTTGDVKLMVYNGEALCHQICIAVDMDKETNDIMYPKRCGKIKSLAMIPFHHIFGFVAVFLLYTYFGKTLVFPTSNSPTEILSLCQKANVTHVFSVPLFWDALAQGLERKAALAGEEKVNLLKKMVDYNLGKISKEEAGMASWPVAKQTVQKSLLGNKIRFCISGGGYLSKETLNTINGIGYNLYNGFGMTEVGVTSVELTSDMQVRLKGSVGKPLYGVSYKINKKEKADDKGELLIKSSAMHIREIIGGVEQNVSLDEEGYFSSGDIATTDETGRYYISGRIKDIIINADGENIFPDELEHFFKGIPHVTNLCVLGAAIDNSQYENVVLVLEVDNSTGDVEMENIRNEVKERGKNLPHKVHIYETYLSKNKLPLANNMKIKRYVVKKAIEAKSKDFISIDAKKKTKKFVGFDEATVEKILMPVRALFSKILILPAFKIEDDAHWINDLGGDSMSYVELIKDVQDNFQVTIPEELYGELTCVNDFVLEIAKLQKGENK
ncbi:MAG: non-ribosomal peptide synthetase, partial [Bacilli bacterium]|nr:non-ribosomal peptide synthetase [Bacilli bacterium]